MIGTVTRVLVVVAALAAVGTAEPRDDLGARIRAAATVPRSDDARVRKPMLDTLVADGHLTAAAAARVPTAKQIAVQLRRLAPEMRKAECSLVLDTGSDDVVLDCVSVVKRECGFDTVRVATVRVGARWTATDRAQKQRPNELCDF